MPSVYLAARYSRREEMLGVRDFLTGLGHTVTSRWINGMHQLDDAGVPIGDDKERRFEEGDSQVDDLRQKFAQDDINDLLVADIFIAFTEQPRSGGSRGGRHVELGIAIANHKHIIVCGPRENLFCWLPNILHCPTWSDLVMFFTLIRTNSRDI